MNLSHAYRNLVRETHIHTRPPKNKQTKKLKSWSSTPNARCQVKLLDCPGIVFDDSDAGATLLRNCVNAEAMEDPTPAVAAVLKRCQVAQLMQASSCEYSP